MRIKRLELDVEFEYDSMHVFHTDNVTYDEPPTIVTINGQEFEGEVSYAQKGNTYIIEIIKMP